jgi:hypothetical protein
MSIASKRCFVLLLALVVLLGCAAAGPTPTPAVEPTRTPRATFTPLPTETQTLLPTMTPSPVATATLTATPLTPTAEPTATPDPNLSPLTGMRVDDAERLERRVLAVRVGNDPVIRPQEGLGLADIVYEEIMEGYGVTRFTALYLDRDVERIRPIRSARLVNLHIVPQYDAALVHTGASDQIRWFISQADFVDLDEFFNPQPYSILAGYDWRGRIYTSVQRLYAHLERRNLAEPGRIEGYTFDETPPIGLPAVTVRIPYPHPVEWVYDIASGLYQRRISGRPHTEALTGEVISAANVIVIYAEHRRTNIVEDSLGNTAIDIVLEGEGPAQFFRDGILVEATWMPMGENGLIQYVNVDGDILPLRPGKTWIQIVPLDYPVEFSP